MIIDPKNIVDISGDIQLTGLVNPDNLVLDGRDSVEKNHEQLLKYTLDDAPGLACLILNVEDFNSLVQSHLIDLKSNFIAVYLYLDGRSLFDLDLHALHVNICPDKDTAMRRINAVLHHLNLAGG